MSQPQYPGNGVTLRPATPNDLAFIVELERAFCDLGFVGADSIETHQRQLSDPDCLYCLVQANTDRAGYVIIRGLTSVNRCVELKRIVIAEPGRGLGRLVLSAILNKVFTEFSAHRLWLDVYEDNHRARRVYRALGFVEEGTLRECIRHGARYRSLVVMSMLESEYRAMLADDRQRDIRPAGP